MKKVQVAGLEMEHFVYRSIWRCISELMFPYFLCRNGGGDEEGGEPGH